VSRGGQFAPCAWTLAKEDMPRKARRPNEAGD
jgi:hypothetical protein